ncbi:phenylalanine--tRNA ligase subunit beta [Candidatus Annandia pinicola]|uniref:phenylalanine--tRNA ligase subunit beta n=1 Tax=Candidatus Annandia pinicola TaxID=1345117 RepID=UPI001D00FAB3|nr:phenylalanine--tRNA ligase subunit beta [Candidatus Annandia pinicola]UDG80383.1 Phenylalanine--tRNA ligase beta subunit [Candidatus Annandia pinicola]
MKLNTKWLYEFLKYNITTKLLCKQLLILGIEINNILNLKKIFSKIIVGKIVNFSINKKNICSILVNLGKKKNIIVNYKYNNYYIGLKLAVLKYNDINKNKNYKICSFSEIGLKKSDNKIIKLDNSIPIGTNIGNFFNVNDNIININTNTNRFDYLSIIGIAKDLSILNNFSIKSIKKYNILKDNKDFIPIKINNKKACPIYICVTIKNINNKIDTPKWMQSKLYSYGLSSKDIINNIINYLIIELGIPLYVLNLDCINNYINIRMSEKGEYFNLSKNKIIKLKKNTLLINDKNKILSLAGVYVNKIAKVSKNSKNILLSCAFFNYKYVLGKKEIYKIKNNIWNNYSSTNINLNLLKKSFMKAIYFIKKFSGGKVGKVTKKIYKKFLPNNKIKIKVQEIYNIIGIKISKKKIIKILKNIDCYIKLNKNYWNIVTPKNRSDILIKEDIIKEIIKFYGYNNIPMIPIKNSLLKKKNICHIKKKIKCIKNFLLNKGYQEIITYSFINPKLQKILFPNIVPLKICNYISKEMSIMRSTLLNGLISTLLYNQNRQKKSIKLFEYGTCFINNKFNLIDQVNCISGLLNGNIYDKNWIMKPRIVDFYDMKGDIEILFNILGNNNIKFLPNNLHKYLLHPGQGSLIYQNSDVIGYMGTLHPILQKKLNINNKTIIFEILYDKVILKKKFEYKNFSKFPCNNRNINIIIDNNILSENIILFCKKITKKIINVELIDVYHNNIDKNKKSITISLTLQSKKKTLEDNEINKIVKNCLILLKKKFNAYLKY